MYELVFLKEAIVDYKKFGGMLVGEPLAKKKYDLSMCREIKMRRLGLRIVFKQNKQSIEIIDIVTVGKRSDSEVFKEARLIKVGLFLLYRALNHKMIVL